MQTISIKQLLDKWAAAVAGTDQPQPPAYTGPDVTLTHLVEHTDHVGPGTAFVARVRTGSDGHAHIGKAAAKGAGLIVGQRPPADLGSRLPPDVPYLQVEDTAVATAWLSAAWHDFPGRELVVIGVTGTDGKTTTVNLIFEMLRQAGLSTGMVSTIKAAVNDQEEALDLHVTTPEAPVVQRYLRRMADAGVTHCVLETTSHALAQHRVDAAGFDVAVVTNITHEHLDYHGSYEAYLAAKARLFEMVAGGRGQGGRGRGQGAGGKGQGARGRGQGAGAAVVKTAVLNYDDQSFAPLSRIATPRRITYGLSTAADVYADHVRYEPGATHFDLHLSRPESGPGLPVSSQLVGDFNLYNMLAAAAVGQSLGLAPDMIQKALSAVEIVSGRMERIDRGQPFLVIVDFAHTPVSLEKAIGAARRMANGRVITVFGSAGKRDIVKRRLMAETSARDADLTVLTAEDPRTDSLAEILDAMAEGCRNQGGVEGESFWRVPDRGEAIYFALTLARPEDVVLICGKGHEQSMCFGVTEYPWDDRDATSAALDAFLAGRPMVDLGLPTAGDRGHAGAG
jgi:UDP-N-acetylmuramoyl-L-alanyl-D-glutamate--2,6-diaminopimelate ligase